MSNDFRFSNNFNPYQMNNSFWNKYNNLINQMSSEQKNYVGKQKNVLSAKQNLLSEFIDYLFEQHKNNFVLASEHAKKLADEYITSIQKAADSYVTHSEELEKENADLKKQIQQLMLDFGEKKNGKNNRTTE